METLITSELTKKYRRVTALSKLNLSIEQGMVFGFLGPNGSGKTTTLGLLLDVLKPTSGSYRWFGQEPTADTRKKIGAILETPCFYPYLSGIQNLKIVAQIKECPPSQIDPVLETVGLSERSNDPFKTYSLGMKQRLAIASALIADPEVLILDEPTNGLDPQGIVEIREIIRNIAQTGKTIILASHLLDEVQKVCTHFMVLRKGEKLYQGSVNEALDGENVTEIAAKNLALLNSVLQGFNAVKKMETDTDKITITTAKTVDTEDINRYLIEQGVIATHLMKKAGNLETEFLRILKNGEQ